MNIKLLGSGCSKRRHLSRTAKDVVEDAGYKPTKSILLARDIRMKKHSIYEGGERPTHFAQHSDDGEVRKAKNFIVKDVKDTVEE